MISYKVYLYFKSFKEFLRILTKMPSPFCWSLCTTKRKSRMFCSLSKQRAKDAQVAEQDPNASGRLFVVA